MRCCAAAACFSPNEAKEVAGMRFQPPSISKTRSAWSASIHFTAKVFGYAGKPRPSRGLRGTRTISAKRLVKRSAFLLALNQAHCRSQKPPSAVVWRYQVPIHSERRVHPWTGLWLNSTTGRSPSEPRMHCETKQLLWLSWHGKRGPVGTGRKIANASRL